MGHWYTQDYVIAGVLTAIRVGGIAIGLAGIINGTSEKIYIGSGMAIISYALDIADAPYSAERYNDQHAQAFLYPEKTHGKSIPLLAYQFRF